MLFATLPGHVRQSVWVTLLIFGILVSACTVPAPGDTSATNPPAAESVTTPTEPTDDLFPLTVTDAAGQEFTFDAPPKIGCYWYGCFEAFADLGLPFYAGSLPPEELESVFYAPVGPPIHLIADDSNPENWAAAEIDLFVTRVPDSADLDPMRAVAPVFFLHHPSYGESDQQGYGAYIEDLRLLGALAGKPEAAEAAIARFETLLTNLKALATPDTQALNIAVVFSGEGYRVISPDNPFCAAVAETGLGHCVGEGAATWEVSAESFLALDPDWIAYSGFGESYQDRIDPVWTQLTAVKEGRVFDAAGSRYYCCSTRGLIHALQDYVSHILPDAGIPNPGPELTFDPLQSPLVLSATTAVPATTTAATRQVVHELGTTEVPTNPQRIVALHDLSIANNMVQLGVVPIGAANAEDARAIGDFVLPDSVAPAGSSPEPNLEQIAALKPDLIICLDTHGEIYEQLSAIAPTVAVRDYSAADALAAQRTVADLIGKSDLFNQQVAAYDARVAALREQLAPLQATLEVSAFGIYGENLYITHQIGWTHAKVFADLGLVTPPAITELIGDAEDQSASVSYEELPQLDSDVIFLIDPAYEDGLAKLQATGLLDLTFAGGAEQIFMVDADHWYRGGIAGLNLVLDDIETYLLNTELDTSGDFR